MPEWGMLPIPTKLLKQGVRDMVRMSDARMSGTSYGACLLHCRAEAYIGGPLALVQTGDLITLDVPARRTIHLNVSDAELARAAPPGSRPSRYERGYGWMFTKHISRPTRAATSTFSKPASAPRCPSPIIY
jgi:dihydroxy-acid dehydratase